MLIIMWRKSYSCGVISSPITAFSSRVLQSGIKNGSSFMGRVNSHLSAQPASGTFRNMATTMAREAARVVVQPASCLHDEPVTISVDGLNPGQEITLEASMSDIRGVGFHSYAYYKADDKGRVDANTMESLGGAYKGVFPMGLLSSFSPALLKHKHTRYFKRDVENPTIVTLSAFRGHLSHDELVAEERDDPLSTASHMRHYMASGVQRIPVRYKSVRGCLFLPPGDGPFPGVVDLFGTAGGLIEYRSAQLASRGIASLALAYFAYDDLPKFVDEFHISYFEDAVQFLLAHDKILKPDVGVIGVSKGGDLALSMATFIPEVTAVVWINGCISNVQYKLNLHNSALPGLEFDIGRAEVREEALDLIEAVDNPLDFPETIIPIEKADANFLFLVGVDDKNWKSELYADIAVQRLEKAGKRNYLVNKYPGTGHLIEPPFSPVCRTSYHRVIGGSLLWGGILRPHTEAQKHSWESTLGFFRKHLQHRKGKL